eukprot:3078056-Rhodomonas_salina.1
MHDGQRGEKHAGKQPARDAGGGGGREGGREGGRGGGPVRDNTVALADLGGERIEEDVDGDWRCVERSGRRERIHGPESINVAASDYIPASDGTANMKRFRRKVAHLVSCVSLLSVPWSVAVLCACLGLESAPTVWCVQKQGERQRVAIACTRVWPEIQVHASLFPTLLPLPPHRACSSEKLPNRDDTSVQERPAARNRVEDDDNDDDDDEMQVVGGRRRPRARGGG